MRIIGLLLASLQSASSAKDGLALTPPRGWRDWNQWQGDIDMTIMMSTIDAMTDTSRGGVSLASVGYSDVGLDDAWQMCGIYSEYNYTYHQADGTPVVNTTKFPSLSTMTAYGHAHNLTMGFYGNNCRCKDHISDAISFAAEANFVIDNGFDSVKLDGCGAQENIELWYNIVSSQARMTARSRNTRLTQFLPPTRTAQYNWTRSSGKRAGKGILIENCHNGPHSGSPASVSPFGPHVPTADWCPFHYYRSSTDIAPVFGSILSNLETIPPLAAANLSTPGCWAYPDMLEVGVLNTQSLGVPPLNYNEARSHFGAWSITSSPLILGLDVTNATTLDTFWNIITNTEAIAVNQDYAGFSGSRFFASDDVTLFQPCGWWAKNCSFPTIQYWYKPMSNGDVAVLLLNAGDQSADLTLEFHNVPGLEMPQGSQAKVRDIWNHADLGTYDGAFTAGGVTTRDSVFLRLSPVSSR